MDCNTSSLIPLSSLPPSLPPPSLPPPSPLPPYRLCAQPLQHVISHHPFTNVNGADPDVMTYASVGTLAQPFHCHFTYRIMLPCILKPVCRMISNAPMVTRADCADLVADAAGSSCLTLAFAIINMVGEVGLSLLVSDVRTYSPHVGCLAPAQQGLQDEDRLVCYVVRMDVHPV